MDFKLSMGGYGVIEVSARAGETIGGMVNGTSLTSGFIAGLGACESCRLMGAETHVNMLA